MTSAGLLCQSAMSWNVVERLGEHQCFHATHDRTTCFFQAQKFAARRCRTDCTTWYSCNIWQHRECCDNSYLSMHFCAEPAEPAWHMFRDEMNDFCTSLPQGTQITLNMNSLDPCAAILHCAMVDTQFACMLCSPPSTASNSQPVIVNL